MIEAVNISKSYDDIKAVDNVSLTVKEGEVFGLIGTNGAGKSTFLRMMAGILRTDSGKVLIDGEEIYENPIAKKKIFYISDEQYFYPSSTGKSMADFYKSVYEDFDNERFQKLCNCFELDSNRKIRTFSKGMKKQLSVILGVCSNTGYLYCDETFDGLDPVMRQAVKSLFSGEMADRDFTPVIASHNLRELEDICDHVGLLHKGGVILSEDLGNLKSNIHKIQCVLSDEADAKDAFKDFDIVSLESRGKLITLTARGERDELMGRIAAMNPVFSEALPLSLEEIFISETGVMGYDIKKLIL